MPNVKRGEVWLVDYEPQAFKAEPGKRARPSLVVQTDVLNGAGHSTTIVIPGTSDIESDSYPLRVFLGQIQKPGEQPKDTDLLIDQVKAISNERFMGDAPLAKLSINHMKKVETALKSMLGL